MNPPSSPAEISPELRSCHSGHSGKNTSSLVLLLWGSAFLYLFFSGKTASFLHPFFHLPVALSGCILVCLALLPRSSASQSCLCKTSPAPSQPTGKNFSPSAIVLLIPLVIMVFISPTQFSATMVRNRGIVESAEQLPSKKTDFLSGGTPFAWTNDPSMDASSYLAKTPDGKILAETIDLLFAAQEPPLRPDFDGKEIEIIGQYLPDHSDLAAPNRFQLLRLFVMCCAADARPIGITVLGKIPEGLPEMAWVKVEGTATFPKIKGRVFPVVEAKSVKPCQEPKNSFLH